MNLGLYLLKRVVAMVPTLLVIVTLGFFLLQMVPGGPVERALQYSRGMDVDVERVTAELNRQYGFDQPIHRRYSQWLARIARLDFGTSTIYGQPVWDVISARFPVSLQFGVSSLVLMYLVSITLGALMASRVGSRLDQVLELGLIAGTAVPPFAIAVALLSVFAGGRFLGWFPLGYLTSEDYESFGTLGRIADRAHHFVLPLVCYLIGGFASIAFLTRNSFLEQMGSMYVTVARSKGISESRILYHHVLRNALLPVVTGIGGYVALFLSGSLLIESIFQIDGIGSLGFRALNGRDYNLVMGLMVLQSGALLVGNLVSDLIYTFVDPRIDFAPGGL